MKRELLACIITIALLVGCSGKAPDNAGGDAGVAFDSSPLTTAAENTHTANVTAAIQTPEPTIEPIIDYAYVDIEAQSYFVFTDDTAIHRPEKSGYNIIRRVGDAIEIGSEEEERMLSLFLGEDYVVFAESEDSASFSTIDKDKRQLVGRGYSHNGKLHYGYNNQFASSGGDVSNIDVLAQEYKEFLSSVIPADYLERVLYPGKKDSTRLPYIKYMPTYDGLAIYSHFDHEGVTVRYTDIMSGASIILSEFESTDEVVEIMPLNDVLTLIEPYLRLNLEQEDYEITEAQVVYTTEDEITYTPSWLITYYLLIEDKNLSTDYIWITYDGMVSTPSGDNFLQPDR